LIVDKDSPPTGRASPVSAFRPNRRRKPVRRGGSLGPPPISRPRRQVAVRSGRGHGTGTPTPVHRFDAATHTFRDGIKSGGGSDQGRWGGRAGRGGHGGDRQGLAVESFTSTKPVGDPVVRVVRGRRPGRSAPPGRRRGNRRRLTPGHCRSTGRRRACALDCPPARWSARLQCRRNRACRPAGSKADLGAGGGEKRRLGRFAGSASKDFVGALGGPRLVVTFRPATFIGRVEARIGGGHSAPSGSPSAGRGAGAR